MSGLDDIKAKRPVDTEAVEAHRLRLLEAVAALADIPVEGTDDAR